MQHYKPVFYLILRHPYDTPTFKSNALRLISSEGLVKRLLLLYKWLIQINLVFFGYNWRYISPFSTRTVPPPLKLKLSVLLAMKRD